MQHARIGRLVVGLFACTVSAHAQGTSTTVMLPNKDVTGLVGLLGVDEEPGEAGSISGDTVRFRAAYTAAGFGYYWTEHAKTEVEIGASTTASDYTVGFSGTGAAFRSTTAERFFRTDRLTVGQSYQFRHNTTFHPSIGAGIDIDWNHRRTETTTWQSSPPSRPVTITAERPTTSLTAKAFVSAGAKAYVSERAFFKTDARFDFVRRFMLRIGFGFDF